LEQSVLLAWARHMNDQLVFMNRIKNPNSGVRPTNFHMTTYLSQWILHRDIARKRLGVWFLGFSPNLVVFFYISRL